MFCVFPLWNKKLFMSPNLPNKLTMLFFFCHIPFMWRTYRLAKQLIKAHVSMDFINGLPPHQLVHTVRKDSPTSWHHKLGHPSSSIFKFISQHFSLGTNQFQQFDCNSCQISKSHRLPFHESTLISYYPLEIIFSDVWTSPILSIDGLRYYCMFVDHFIRYIWLYPMNVNLMYKSYFPNLKPLLKISINNK